MPNYNQTTGIPYGILAANNVPELFDDIISNGDDLTYESWKSGLKESIERALVSALDEFSYRPEELVKRAIDSDELVENLLDSGLGDSYQPDESEYSYEYKTPHGAVKLLVQYLGGAPLIWVIESPYLMLCRKCSPCIPGGGDLDSPSNSGDICYSLPPDDLPEELQSKAILRKLPFSEVLSAVEVVFDEHTSEAPWESCDGFEHEVRRREYSLPENARKSRAYLGNGEYVEIDQRDFWGVAAYAHANGASKGVAAELLAINNRRTIDSLVDWRRNGWSWYGVKGELYGREASLWGIDSEEYANGECRREIAMELAKYLEQDGFEIVGKPDSKMEYLSHRRAEFKRRLNSQNWSE